MKTTIMMKALLCIVLLIPTALLVGCTQNSSEPAQYVFNLDTKSIATPNEATSQYVRTIGNLTTNSYESLNKPSPQWSRIIIRDMNAPNGITDSVNDLQISDQFRFEVEGGYTSIEKPNDSSTYIIDVTNSGRRSITCIPRKATEDELAEKVTIITIILAIAAAALYFV